MIIEFLMSFLSTKTWWFGFWIGAMLFFKLGIKIAETEEQSPTHLAIIGLVAFLAMIHVWLILG